MSKLIIYVSGKPNIYGFKRAEFKWSQEHKKFLFLGREIEESEFNALAERALNNYHDMNPRVMFVGAPAASEESLQPAPVATIGTGEITLEMAEEVIQRLAPQRLKKKSGPKPNPAAVVAA